MKFTAVKTTKKRSEISPVVNFRRIFSGLSQMPSRTVGARRAASRAADAHLRDGGDSLGASDIYRSATATEFTAVKTAKMHREISLIAYFEEAF